MVILLDLNYTLVGNSVEQRSVRPAPVKIGGEVYRDWLLKSLAQGDNEIILVTARPEYQRELTEASLREKLGWVPSESHYNDQGQRPHDFKEKVLTERILTRFDASELVAVESNPKSRAMYARYGVPSLQVARESGEMQSEASKQQLGLGLD